MPIECAGNSREINIANSSICLWTECGRIANHARGLCKRCHQRAFRAGVLDSFTAPLRTCGYCDDKFAPSSRGGNVYCSSLCSALMHLAQQRTRCYQAQKMRNCAYCSLVVPWNLNSDAQHCSVKCQQAAWYRQHEEILRARASEWGTANPELRRYAARQYYLNNLERTARQTAAWRAANPEKNREIRRASAARRRALKRGVATERFKLDEI